MLHHQAKQTKVRDSVASAGPPSGVPQPAARSPPQAQQSSTGARITDPQAPGAAIAPSPCSPRAASEEIGIERDNLLN